MHGTTRRWEGRPVAIEFRGFFGQQGVVGWGVAAVEGEAEQQRFGQRLDALSRWQKPVLAGLNEMFKAYVKSIVLVFS